MSSRTTGLETVSKGGIKPIATSASDGAAYVQLPDTACNQLAILNDSGVVLRAQYCSNAGAAIAGESHLLIPDGMGQPFRGISNAKQVQIRRDDGSTTPVTVKFTFELA